MHTVYTGFLMTDSAIPGRIHLLLQGKYTLDTEITFRVAAVAVLVT
jgi:hypothetical protein